MKNKEKYLEKLEKISAPVIVTTEQHIVLLVVLALGVVSFVPVPLLIPAFLHIFTVEGLLFLLAGWFMVIIDRRQTYWGIFCCANMWIVACLGIVYIHTATGYMFEGADFWDSRRMFFVWVAFMAYFVNMDSVHTFPAASGFSGKDLRDKGTQYHQN